MKKLLLAFCVLGSIFSYSQFWFDVGLKGGAGIGFPLNKTINNDGRFGVSPGFNWFGGGKVGVNYGHYIGITFDVDYGGYAYGFVQAEVPGKTQTENFKYKISYNAINLMPMFRFTKEASFIEIGPQFQMLRNQTIDDEAFPGAVLGTDYIANRLTGLTFGFGGHMIGNEIIALMMGIRINYVLSDLTAEAYRDSSFPFTNYPDISSHSKTSPINVQVSMEVNYSLGYIARSSSGCGKRAAFLSF